MKIKRKHLIVLWFFLFRSCFSTTWANGIFSWENNSVSCNFDAIAFESIKHSRPFFNTQNKKIQWKIYLKEIGFTEDLSLEIPCFWQKTGQCKVVGTGENATIGKLDFSHVLYDAKTGKFFGSIKSAIGDLSVNGISLGNSETLLEKTDFLANHTENIHIQSPEKYKIYELELDLVGKNFKKQYIAKNGVFEHVDLSLAGTYNTKITKKNAQGITEGISNNSLKVSANSIAKNIETIDFQAKKFCREKSDAIICPDGNVRKASIIEENTTLIADGRDAKFIIKLRDKYGNRVSGKNLEVQIENTVKTVQTSIWEYKKQLQSSQGVEIANMSNPNNTKSFVTHNNRDTIINAKLLAPTNQNNVFAFKKITYDGYDISDILAKNIQISPAVTTHTRTQNLIYTNKNAPFTISIKKPVNIWNVQITTKITTENGFFIFGKPEKQDTPFCTSSLSNGLIACDGWDLLEGNNFHKNQQIGLFQFSTNKNTESINALFQTTDKNIKTFPIIIKTFVQYAINGVPVMYQSESLPAENITIAKTSTIAGISSNQVFQNGSIIGTKNTFKNMIRKNISYLKRNTKNYDNLNYEIIEGKNVKISHISEKRSYIVIGGDIEIDKNIINSPEPVAIIALQKNGNGGNIIIDDSVTDIESSLIAEWKILPTANATKEKQLYIFGMVIAENDCLDNSANCLPNLRENYNGNEVANRSKNKNAEKSKFSQIIIEKNDKLSQNPPPGIQEIIP